MIFGKTFVFVHVPKTGGQSVSLALPGGKSVEAMHRPRFATDAGDRKAFGFVRNPWDRMVSLYAFMCQKPVPPSFADRQREMKDNGFKWWLTQDRYFMDQDVLFKCPIPMQRRPQTWWLTGCDLVGRFESIGADFKRICEELKITAVDLPHINRSRHAAYREYYDAEARAFVAEHFRTDIERYGYAFWWGEAHDENLREDPAFHTRQSPQAHGQHDPAEWQEAPAGQKAEHLQMPGL